MCRSARWLNSLHSIHPTAAESQLRCCTSRKPAASIPFDFMSASYHHRIGLVPFTLKNLKEDLEDVGANFDGSPDLEFRLATQALELEQSGLGYQRIPPNYRFPYGHTHKRQEELYVVIRGSGRMKL